MALVREVGPDEVFNLPLYEHHLVIDIRPAEEFSRGPHGHCSLLPLPPSTVS